MPRDDVIDLFHTLRLLEAKGYWEKQEEMSATDGRGYDDKSRNRMCQTHTTCDFGAWRAVKFGLPQWPMGAILVQEAYDDCNFLEVAETHSDAHQGGRNNPQNPHGNYEVFDGSTAIPRRRDGGGW
jgi:hypothetical protein